MTPRALDALRSADAVCAEDTRVTGKLLAAFDIHAHLERLDEASIAARAGGIVERVLAGQTIAYCSDAGMPGVSDPGQRLIAAARAAGAPVCVLPGPTAVATAYVASGFTCPRFYFGGFFPRKQGERKTTLHALQQLDAVLVFYESPRRVVAALQSIAQVMPQRQVAVCRELTKLHEEILVDTPSALAAHLEAREEGEGIKGEIVLVIDVPSQTETEVRAADVHKAAQERAAQLAATGRLSKKDIARALQSEFGLQRNEAYALVHGA